MSDRTHPDSGPVTPGEAGFTAADMATAAAQGFRDGVASVVAENTNTEREASAILSKICDLFHIGIQARTESTIIMNVENVIHHARLLHAVERDLFPQPELPEDDDPYATVGDELPAPNSWAAKDEADYVAQFRAALAARASMSLPAAGQEPVAHLWQHSETGRTRVVMPDMIVDADASWQVVGPLVLAAAPQPAVAAGWISVEERLPFVRTDVLIARGTGLPCERTIAFYDPDRYTPAWRYTADPSGGIRGVTHWQPLPLPPAPSTEGDQK